MPLSLHFRRTVDSQSPTTQLASGENGDGLCGILLGTQADQLVLFFDGCRRKRNVIDYTGVQIATSTEAAELLQRAREFSVLVEAWIKSAHPHLN